MKYLITLLFVVEASLTFRSVSAQEIYGPNGNYQGTTTGPL